MKEGTYASMVRIQTRTATKRESILPSPLSGIDSSTQTHSMQALFSSPSRTRIVSLQ